MTDEQWRAWTREHQACYEVLPLVQLQGKDTVQVGFEVELVALMPEAGNDPAARQKGTQAVLKGLTELAQLVFPPGHSGEARFELAPFRAVAQLRPGQRPEVRRQVNIVHRKDLSQPVAGADRQKLAPFEQRLKDLGVAHGSWHG